VAELWSRTDKYVISPHPRAAILASLGLVVQQYIIIHGYAHVGDSKEESAMFVKTLLAKTMTQYGFQILQVLITDLDPDQRVKNAINEINSSKRLKFAVAERSEGEKS
jgi:regulator of protease activity HflC (stomatin/prohibitin superfamily)